MEHYYSERAGEYDAIYGKPERQEDITLLSHHLIDLLKEKTILELACGTGFWTRFLAPVAKSITITDYSKEMLAIARNRLNNFKHIEIVRDDIFTLANIRGEFNAGLAAFWWSHVEKAKINTFLEAFHARLLPGSIVVFADNIYVDGSSTSVSRTDAVGNTYQIRRLSDGRRFEILKNFTTEQEFRDNAEKHGKNIHYKSFTYFWCGWYETQ